MKEEFDMKDDSITNEACSSSPIVTIHSSITEVSSDGNLTSVNKVPLLVDENADQSSRTQIKIVALHKKITKDKKYILTNDDINFLQDLDFDRLNLNYSYIDLTDVEGILTYRNILSACYARLLQNTKKPEDLTKNIVLGINFVTQLIAVSLSEGKKPTSGENDFLNSNLGDAVIAFKAEHYRAHYKKMYGFFLFNNIGSLAMEFLYFFFQLETAQDGLKSLFKNTFDVDSPDEVNQGTGISSSILDLLSNLTTFDAIECANLLIVAYAEDKNFRDKCDDFIRGVSTRQNWNKKII